MFDANLRVNLTISFQSRIALNRSTVVNALARIKKKRGIGLFSSTRHFITGAHSWIAPDNSEEQYM
jgi:hypothetical protein